MPSPEIMIEPRPVPGRRAPPERGPAPPPPPSPPPPPPSEPVMATRKPPRRWLRTLGWLALIVVLWSAWPLYALYDLSSALDTEDAVGLERRIDSVSVRQGLRDDLRVMLGSARLGEIAPDRTVDPLITQRAIVALIRSVRLNDRGWDMEGRPGRGFDLFRIRYAFFTGGPFAFRVDLKPDTDSVRRPLVLLFRWAGDWRLTRVFLPGDAFGNTPPAPVAPAPQASAEPQAAAPSTSAPAPAEAPAAAKTPPPPGAQRVMLYEEDPSDPNGKSYPGWAVWRVEPGQSPTDAAIICQIAVPDRPLAVTLTIRRNLDRSLPASHTVDVKFDIPSNSPTQGVLDVAGIMMKPNEEASGQQLSGTRVKVSKDVFLVGLSAIEFDAQQNLQILKDRPWLGIPFVYGNSNRAVLSVEKGETGSKIINETLAQWGPTAAAPAPAPEARGQRR